MDLAWLGEWHRIRGRAFFWRCNNRNAARRRNPVAGTAVDLEKLLRMALLHDWAETRLAICRKQRSPISARSEKEAELAAFADIVAGTRSGGADYCRLHEEYERRTTIEAKIVKAADVIDLLVQALAMERSGARGLDEFWEVAQDGDFQLEGTPHEVVQEILAALIDARAQLEK
jgi:5'-deoxynucleotidase YfbR-like HD superfamily hydrolase